MKEMVNDFAAVVKFSITHGEAMASRFERDSIGVAVPPGDDHGPRSPGERDSMRWLGELKARFRRDRPQSGPEDARKEIETWFRGEIVPALDAVRRRLAREGYSPWFCYGDDWASLAATNFNGLPLEYRARGHVYAEPVVNLSSVAGTGADDTLKRYSRIEIYSAGRSREYRPSHCTRAAVERAARKYFRRFLLDSPMG